MSTSILRSGTSTSGSFDEEWQTVESNDNEHEHTKVSAADKYFRNNLFNLSAKNLGAFLLSPKPSSIESAFWSHDLKTSISDFIINIHSSNNTGDLNSPSKDNSINTIYLKMAITLFMQESWRRKAINNLVSLNNNQSMQTSANTETIKILEGFLKKLSTYVNERNIFPIPFIAPIEGGLYQFEWERNVKYLEFEFISNEEFSFLKIHGQTEDEGICSINQDITIKELIEWFCE